MSDDRGSYQSGTAYHGNFHDRFRVLELRLLPRSPPPNEFFQKGKDFQQRGRDQESGDVYPGQWIQFKDKVEACNVRTEAP